jgi:beta-lactam-binding protein with PASTA domain
MPNLIGQNFLDAKQNIEKAGFQVERIYTPTQDAVQDGKVATQNPVAGQQVFSDSKITLTTYQVASIKMPKLVRRYGGRPDFTSSRQSVLSRLEMVSHPDEDPS